jgi:hydroxyacylglutathione hydrolase
MNIRIHPVSLHFQLPINAEKSVERLVQAYVVVGQQVCVVDTGVAGSQQGIVDTLTRLGKSLADVAWVVNTHEHPDHAGGNGFFQEATQPGFACHVEAVRWIEKLDVQYAERPMFGFYELIGQPIRVTRQLSDGEEIDLGGGTTLQVISTPGHSPGSMSLFCPQDGSLITGDAIPPTGGLPLYLDLAQSRQSLRRLLALPGVKSLYHSHVEQPYTGSEIAAVLQGGLDYLARMEEIVAQAVRALPANAGPEEITREALVRLGLSPPPVMPVTIATIKAHLA